VARIFSGVAPGPPAVAFFVIDETALGEIEAGPGPVTRPAVLFIDVRGRDACEIATHDMSSGVQFDLGGGVACADGAHSAFLRLEADGAGWNRTRQEVIDGQADTAELLTFFFGDGAEVLEAEWDFEEPRAEERGAAGLRCA